MAKNTLVIGRELSKDMEFSGRYLLKELLKKQHIKIDAAMWFFFPDQIWKYLLIVNNFNELGPSNIYREISKINNSSISKRYKPIPLESIEAKGESSFVYRMMKGPGGMRYIDMRISNSMINGLEITDSFIYEFK